MRTLMKAALIRALRTVFQTALGMLGASAAMAEINWQVVIVASLLSGGMSLSTSMMTGLPEAREAPEPPDNNGKGGAE